VILGRTNSTVGACPSRAELADYLAGRLSRQQLERVAEHVSNCSSCEAALPLMDDGSDALDAWLRRYAKSRLDADEAAWQRLAARAMAIGQERAAETPGPSASESKPPPPNGPDAPAGSFPKPFGKYRLLEKLGKGGMGVVYKAVEVPLDRVVALKIVLAGAHATPEQMARFQVEARAVARLKHENVVLIYEAHQHDEVPYFTMELLEGGSLLERLKQHTFTAHQAAELMQALAGAMEAAHQKGIVHRDLKPGNVLLDAHGTPKVADFGLAKLLDANLVATESDVAMGTAAYMAPEQAAGGSKDVGPAADVYSLGAILYELLCGRPPFQGNRIELLDQVRTQEPPPPARWQPGIDRTLEAICLKCLEKRPGQRYPSAGVLAKDLEDWREGRPTRVRPWGWWRRLQRAVRKRAAVLALVGVVGMGLVLANVLQLFPDSRRPAPEDPDKAVQDIEARLARKERVVLVPQKGFPAWYRWAAGQGQANVSEAPDGTLSVHTWGLSLLELVRDPQNDCFRIRAQVRHERSDDAGAVGIYFGHRQQLLQGAVVHTCVQLAYNDIRDVRDHIARVERIVKQPLPVPKGNRVFLMGHLYALRLAKPFADDSLAGLQPEMFKAAGFQAGVWRTLVVEVRPDRIKGYWQKGEHIGDVRVGRLLDSFKDAMVERKVWRSGDRRLPAGFIGRGGIGLFLRRGSASFKNVTVEPLVD
jgi:serine/threonine-protein kinase